MKRVIALLVAGAMTAESVKRAFSYYCLEEVEGISWSFL
jgi:hypothetical protein